MKFPTPEEIAQAKADAARRFGRDEALQVEVRPPVDACVLVAPLDLRAFCAYVDANRRDLVTSFRALVLERRLWPNADEVLDLLRRRPSAARTIAAELTTRAGKMSGAPSVEPLEDLVARAETEAGEAIPGLTIASAKALLDAPAAEGESRRELWGVVGPHPKLSLVMATPDPDINLAAQAASVRAREKGERHIESLLDFAKAAIVWSRTPVDALLTDLPSLSQDINGAYLIMGGEGAEASSKSL